MVSLHQQKQRLSARLQTAFQREHIWHTLWLILTWACLIYACLRTWQVIQGRMYYLLDSDMSSDLLLSYRLRQEHALLTTNWFYSTELRIFHNHLVFAPLFFLSDNWLQVRTIGTAIILLGMLASCWYFCRQAGIGHLFPAIGTLLVTPVSDVYFRITLLTVSYPPHLFAAFLCCGVLFQYIRCKKRPVRIALLVFLTLFSFVIGLGGLRQVLTFYLPLTLTALFLCFVYSAPQPGRTLPGLAVPERRLLTGSLLATAATLGGWLVNTRVLRYIYHFSSQEGIHFTDFDGERVERLFFGWLESFGFQTGEYVTSPQIFYNVFCFCALLIIVCAYISLARHPQRYTFFERVFYLLSFFAFVVYEGLYLFTDMVVLHPLQHPRRSADDAGGGGLPVPPAPLPPVARDPAGRHGGPAAVVRQRLLHRPLAEKHDRQPGGRRRGAAGRRVHRRIRHLLERQRDGGTLQRCIRYPGMAPRRHHRPRRPV